MNIIESGNTPWWSEKPIKCEGCGCVFTLSHRNADDANMFRVGYMPACDFLRTPMGTRSTIHCPNCEEDVLIKKNEELASNSL